MDHPVFISTDGASSLYEVPTSVIVVLCFFYGAISVTAAVGNTLVIYVVVVSRRMHTVTNYYIANLALADVTIAVLAIPFQGLNSIKKFVLNLGLKDDL